MRLLLAALLAALLLTSCANAGPAPRPAGTTAAGAPVSSAPFYLTTYLVGGSVTGPAVQVIDGFTGQVEATIAAPANVGSLSWNPGRPVWDPCGAAPDDRTFLLCGARQYWELRLGNDGKPQAMSAPANLPVAARNNGNGGAEFAISPDRRLAADVTNTGIMVLSLVTGATRSWAIPSGDGYAESLSWAGDRYVAFQFVANSLAPQSLYSDAGVRVLDTSSAATAALAASRLVISNEAKLSGGITGVFNPVITPDGSTIVTAAWTGFNVAELAEFSAQTGRLLAVLIPAAHMPGSGSPCQALWTDSSGAHLIAYCNTGGVVNGTRFTPVNLHVPNTSGIAYGILW
jgi:hypothetical protein